MIFPWIASARVTSTRALSHLFPVTGRSTARFARHESTSPGTSPSWLTRSIKTRWSEEEVERLHDVMSIRRSKQEMEAAFPGRRQCAIKRKWWEVRPRDQDGNVHHQKDTPFWSKEEECQLRSLLDDETPLCELRRIFPNRSYYSISNKLQRQQRPGSGQTKFKVKLWTSQDLEQLCHLRFVEKLTTRSVAIKMGRTFNSVASKIERLKRVNLTLAKMQAPADTKGKSP